MKNVIIILSIISVLSLSACSRVGIKDFSIIEDPNFVTIKIKKILNND